MKTILHIIIGLNDGGAEAVLYRLCTQERTRRHHVFSLQDCGKYGPMLEAAGIEVTSIDMPRGKVTVAGMWQLWREIKRLRPDVVQTWMYHADLLGGVAARLAGIKNICWGIHHTTLVPGESSRSTILVMLICARLSRLIPRRIVCCAEESLRVHAAQGYDRERMRVVHNGHEVSVFQFDPVAGLRIREELELRNDSPVIGFIARFDPLKDHKNLLQALARLKSEGITPICLLVGTGMDKDNSALNAMIASLRLGDQIRLLGQRTDIPDIMNALDIHVMSSSGEAFPNVLCEAMACGTPCITTDVGDAARIVGPTGWVVPPRDPEALAHAIKRALDERSKQTWRARRNQSRDRIHENFTVDKMLADYNAVWLEPEVNC